MGVMEDWRDPGLGLCGSETLLAMSGVIDGPYVRTLVVFLMG